MSYRDTVSYTNIRGESKKTLVNFNKVKPYVNAVKGFMAQNRRRPKYEARMENGQLQELFSGYANTVSDYVRDNANADQVETQQDGDMLINGYGCVETALSYGEGYATTEADGEVIIGRLDPLCVGWDPHAAATNLLDRRWDYASKEYDLDEAKKLFSRPEEDFQSADDNDGDTETKYEYFPYGGQYDKIAPLEWTNKDRNMVKVYFYQWYDIEEYYKAANPLFDLVNPQTVQAVDAFLQMLAQEVTESGDETFDPRAEILVFNGETKAKLEEYFGDLLGDVFVFKRKVFYEAVISGESVFNAYKSVSQQGYRRQFKTGDYDAANGIWTGMVNSMMEPVLYYNKALAELMYTIAANSKGGVFAEEGATDDVAEFEANYNKTDGVVWLNEGGLAKVKEKAAPHLPTGLDNLIGMTDNALRDVNGFDVTFMGSREFANDTASFQRQRIKQAMSLLACYFDSATLYQKTCARILLDLMKVFVENNQGMAIRVIGAEGQAMFLQLQSKQLSAEYDVSIGEAPLTVQDKQEQAQILIGMGDKLIMTDPPTAKLCYGMAVELMPLDFSIKERLKATFAPKDQEINPAYVQQLEQMLEQLKSEGSQAQLEKLRAGARKDQASAEKILAEIPNTQANTTKTILESEQKSIENDIVKRSNTTNVSVTI